MDEQHSRSFLYTIINHCCILHCVTAKSVLLQFMLFCCQICFVTIYAVLHVFLQRIHLHQVRMSQPLLFLSLLSLADGRHDKDVAVEEYPSHQEEKTKQLKDKLVSPTGKLPVLLTDHIVEEDGEQPNDKGAKSVQNLSCGCTHVLRDGNPGKVEEGNGEDDQGKQTAKCARV